ncbi:hypothetical protein HOLleu_25594 [Holothuria leucospilota]|uniref:Uncharacterized protein n=1 Tax=Holothuria leucospilota TaxID=206669 RepID=A0A9Q1BSV1_HOLLE|nr:hypothetical protein HOLleu_25594 [Holothuria leucospilota]
MYSQNCSFFLAKSDVCYFPVMCRGTSMKRSFRLMITRSPYREDQKEGVYRLQLPPFGNTCFETIPKLQ